MKLLFVLSVLSVATTTSAWAQGWALPAKTPDTTVTCVGCPNTPDGERTVGYKAPISTFTGRFLDSQGTTDWQATFRTARAWNVQVHGNRIYFRIGSSVAAYNLSTFFSRLSSGEKLMSAGSVYPPQPRTSKPEEWLRWDEYFYPEDPDNQCVPGVTKPGCWVTPRVDGQDRLVSFDVDDQGYVYAAAGVFGWGLVKDSYGTGAKFMKSQFQRLALGDPAPSVIAAIKGTGNRYFALVSGGTGTTVAWDVTTRTTPIKLNTFQYGINRWAKTANADRIAITDGSNDLIIYSSDAIVTGNAPIATFPGDYRGLASDGTNFYSYSKDFGSYISVFRPAGSTYVEQKYTVPSQNFTILRYGAGYLAGAGLDHEFRWDARIYKLDSATQQPTEVPLVAHGPGTSISYARAYYTGAPGFAAPTSSYINITDATVYKSPEGKYYLIVCAKGLGDVYEFKGADSITITNEGAVGGLNPNVPATGPGKTFYGDVVRFTATSGSPAVSGVNWTFGNPESAADPNVVNNVPLGSQTHQYSGIPKTAAFAPRRVTAVSTTNVDIRGELDVQLEAPLARFRVANTQILVTQPSTGSTAPIVLGDQFVDASDGSVPSHYASWTIDGLTTKTFPYPSGVDVGACGAHSLKFESFYGPYSPGTFNTNGPTFNVGLDPVSGLYNYTVRPFAASLDMMLATATSLTFTSSSRFSSTAQALPLTWAWELLNAQGVLVPGTNVSGSGTNVSAYVVQKSSIQGANYRARLTIGTSTPLTGTCAGMGTSTAFSAPMNAPDPVIAGGCTNGGSPCSFTANSATAGLDPTAQGWSYNWTVSGGTYFLGSGNSTSRTFAPRFTQPALYTVSVTASNITFGASAPASTTVLITTPDSQCQPLTNVSWVPTFSGANGCSTFSNCQPGEQLSFTVNPYGAYEESCAPHTYQWTFSDGQSLSGRTVSRAFSFSGTARVTISNGAASREYGPLTVTVGTPPPPPPPPGCQTMTNSNTFISYIATSCSSSSTTTTCTNGEVVTFDTLFFGYDPSCAAHTFTWTIDGTPKNGKSVTHTFNTTGNHLVSLQVDRPGQSFTRSLTVPTNNGTTANPCKPLVPNVSLWIDYKNANSTCGPLGGECATGEPVSFSVKEFGEYQISCATHTFTWDFGDNTATVSGRDATHQFAQTGTFPVRVTVNNGAVTATLTQNAKIKESIAQTPTPNIDFTVTTVAGNSFSFLPNFEPPTSVARWAWNFGDGTAEVAGKGTPAAPVAEVHTYERPGTYTVTLRVFGPNGNEYPTHSELVGNSRRRAARH